MKGQSQAINKTELPTGRLTADADGYISYEIQNLQTGVEYLVALYGEAIIFWKSWSHLPLDVRN